MTAVEDAATSSVYAYSSTVRLQIDDFFHKILIQQWVGYENENTVAQRCDWIKDNGLAGAMFWDTSLDDMYGEFCGNGPFPLINKVKSCL